MAGYSRNILFFASRRIIAFQSKLYPFNKGHQSNCLHHCYKNLATSKHRMLLPISYQHHPVRLLSNFNPSTSLNSFIQSYTNFQTASDKVSWRPCNNHLRLALYCAESKGSKMLSFQNKDFRDYICDVKQRYIEAQEKLAAGDLTEREKKTLTQLISRTSLTKKAITEMYALEEDIELVQKLLSDDENKDLQELAIEELEELKEKLKYVQDEIVDLLTPVEVADDNDVLVEFTAGVGGQEAMLFTSDIFTMYQKFAAHMNWRFEILHYDTSDLGGLRHATASISGFQAYKRFKFEGGVHRVQRTPKTEKYGRVHTSTMTVAVLPQPKQIDIKLEIKDLRIETKRASGAGGQHVNTTDSAVRIVHLPTGMVGESQQERSQQKNRQIAMRVLHAKIYSQELEQQTTKVNNLRRQQVGSSGRSEKIRTYNFSQDRITDHRLHQNCFGISEFLAGGELLEDMTDSLVEQSREEDLTFLVEEYLQRK